MSTETSNQFLSPLKQRIFVVMTIVFLTLGYSYQKRKVYLRLTTVQGPVLKKLPKFKVAEFFTGKILRSDNLSIGTNGLLIHFWGTWCGPCAVEFPELMKFSTQLSKKGIKLVLVDINDKKKDAKKFLQRFKKYKNDNTVFVFDPTGNLMPLFGTSKVPETFLFNVQGKHLKKFIGSHEWLKQRYLRQILDYLK